MNSLRVLIVCQYFWPETFRINDLAVKLVARGHDVSVLTGLPNYPIGRFYSGYSYFGPYLDSKDGVKIHRVPLFPRLKGKGWQLVLNYLSFMFTASLWGVLNRKKYDAVLIYQLSPVFQAVPGILISKLKRLPVLFYVQDLWPDSLEATGAVKNATILRLIEKFVLRLYRESALILTQSRAFIERISHQGIPSNRIEYLPNAAEDFYRPVDPSSVSDPFEGVPLGFRVLFAGNLGKAQSLETIIETAKILSDHIDIQFVFLGDGREREFLESEILRLNLSKTVRYLGARPASQMPVFFAHSDVLLVTLRDEKPFSMTVPSKVQSYLACGRPIISNVRGETALVIQESGAGISCEPESPEKLADTVFKMYRLKRQEREEMGKRGREYFIKNFSSETAVSKLEDFLVKTTSDRRL